MNQHPIAFFIFNRPEITRIAFEKIQKYQPKILLIIADGPRQHVEMDQQNCLRDFKPIHYYMLLRL